MDQLKCAGNMIIASNCSGAENFPEKTAKDLFSSSHCLAVPFHCQYGPGNSRHKGIYPIHFQYFSPGLRLRSAGSRGKIIDL